MDEDLDTDETARLTRTDMGFLLALFGKRGDSCGEKKFFLVYVTLYTIAVTGNGFAWNFPSLLVFIAVQATGLAIFPLAFGIIRDKFPPVRVPMATGIVSAYQQQNESNRVRCVLCLSFKFKT